MFFEQTTETLPVAVGKGLDDQFVVLGGPPPCLIRDICHVASAPDSTAQARINVREHGICSCEDNFLVNQLIDPEILRTPALLETLKHSIMKGTDIGGLRRGDFCACQFAGSS